MMTGRIEKRFGILSAAGRTALVPYVVAGDPDLETSAAILQALPGAGADMIELGMPFTDPVADGVAIQKAGQRALAAGASMRRTLEMVRGFRQKDNDTPLILMGYFNPVLAFGLDAFCAQAAEAGVDGMIIVDLPPEEDAVLRIPAAKAGLALIRLVTPVTDESRLTRILEGASGFLYYVSLTGVTGAAFADSGSLSRQTTLIRAHTSLPFVIGFGIRTPEDAATMTGFGANGIVVGSVLAEIIAQNVPLGKAATVQAVRAHVQKLSHAVIHATPVCGS